jgi:hypothetical protein
MFATEKEILNDEDVACKVPPKLDPTIFVRDLDGENGREQRQLSSQLQDECNDLRNFIKLWPLGPTVAKTQPAANGMKPWHEFWAELLGSEASNFKELCPNIALLASLLIVMPHGSVGNERKFSDMNAIKSKTRSNLSQQHLNAASRVRDQKDKMLMPFSPLWARIVKESI